MSGIDPFKRFAVVGYSTRALAEALADSGYQIFSLDRFSDSDTAEVAQCVAIDHWPDGILEILSKLHVRGVLLAGGMENLPRIVGRLSGSRMFVGMTGTTMKKLRDIEFLRKAAQTVSLEIPHFEPELSREHDRGDWLWKPLSSSGGLRIRSAIDIADQSRLKGGYWQRLIPGRSLGVSCIVKGRRGVVVGVTQSLSGDDWSAPQPYIYRGSIGPIRLEREQIEQIERLCASITALCKVEGWLQFDLIEARDKRLWLLECNPRWTAGMEILRIGGLANMAHLHVKTCWNGASLGSFQESQFWDRWAGKAIYYAEQEVAFTSATRKELETALRRFSACKNASGGPPIVTLDIADIPAGVQRFKIGQPVLTLRLQMNRRADDCEPEACAKLIEFLRQGHAMATEIFGKFGGGSG